MGTLASLASKISSRVGGAIPGNGLLGGSGPVGRGLRGETSGGVGAGGLGLAGLMGLAAGNALGSAATGMEDSPGASLSLPSLSGMPGFSAPGSGGAAAYDQQFRDSLGQARSGIETQLRNALTEVGRQEASQLQAVGQLPGEYARLADLARAQVNETTANADSALAATGVQGLAPAGTGAAPLLSAMAMGQSTQQSGVPLLSLGVKDTAGRARGGLAQAKMSAFQQIDQEERAYAVQRAAEERDNAMRVAQMQHDAKVAQVKANNDIKMMQFEMAQRQEAAKGEAAERTLAHQRDLEKIGYSASLKPGAKGAATTGPIGALEVSMRRGSALTPQTVGKYRADSAYTKFVSQLQSLLAGGEQFTNASAAAEFLQKNPKANRNAMSLALADLNLAD